MQNYFITSSGTGIGKTYVTCAIIRALKNSLKSISAIKPIISGFDESQNNDVKEIIAALQQPYNQENIEKTSLYRFKNPLSPDQAAEKESTKIDYQKLLEFCKSATSKSEYNLIEGVGGVLVPLDNNKRIADLISDLNLETLFVVGSYLGSLSHSFAAYEALLARNIKVKAVIVSQNLTPQDELYIPLDDTIKSLANFISSPIIKLEKGVEDFRILGF
jgi:dethiobiotin synthetase